jgi:Tfp pilus assembly major pilin PilA
VVFTVTQLLAAQSDEGSALVGFLILIGIIWFLAAIFGGKDKGYTFQSQTKGVIKKRR